MRSRIAPVLSLGLLAVFLLVAACLASGASAAPVTPSRTPGRATPTPTPTTGPYTARPANTPAPIVFQDPALSTLDGTWIGELSRAANVRTGPGVTYPVGRVWQKGRRVLVTGMQIAANGERWWQVGRYPEPDLYVHASLVSYVAALAVPPSKHLGHWIDVNLTQQTFIAYEGARPVLLGQISSGKKGHETDVGHWQIYWRLPLQDMDGGGRTDGSPYYNLKDVPWVQYFQMSGEALHGAYWHDNFGTPMSHGCVNMSAQNANWLYLWTGLGTSVEVHY